MADAFVPEMNLQTVVQEIEKTVADGRIVFGHAACPRRRPALQIGKRGVCPITEQPVIHDRTGQFRHIGL